jgi:hypothetical protein
MSGLSAISPARLLGFPGESLYALYPGYATDEHARADVAALTHLFVGDACSAASARPGRLLILSLMPLQWCLQLEALMARALRLQGSEVLAAGSFQTRPWVDLYHGRLGGLRTVQIEDFASLSDFVVAERESRSLLRRHGDDIAAIKAYRYCEAPIGWHVLATMSSLAVDGQIVLDKVGRGRLRKLLRRSILLLRGSRRMLEALRPDTVLCMEKGFVSTCEPFYAALSRGTDYVQWTSCHEPNSVMFKRYNWQNFRNHPFSISDAAWKRLSRTPWNDWFRTAVIEQFEAGYRRGDWFKYKNLTSDQVFADRPALVRQLGLDPDRKTATIYSHILNDANLFYGDDLFRDGYEEWLVETVRAASRNSRVNWVLKLHPANVQRNARLGYSGEYGELVALRAAFGEVPAFLYIVRPEERVSPLSFFGITDWGITVRGTVGLELPCFGIPVLTAGTGRYSCKGFTVDSASAQEYVQKLEQIDQIGPLSKAQTRLGILHAFFVFRARPAKYEAMFHDTYSKPGNLNRELAIRLDSMDEIAAHPQMRKITDFLTGREEDFLDLDRAFTGQLL